MTTVLAERGGWIYAKETTTDFFEPRLIIHWWPTGVRWHDFARWFASPERAHEAIGGMGMIPQEGFEIGFFTDKPQWDTKRHKGTMILESSPGTFHSH